jgi:HD-like signal output (HDOD) protein
VIIFTIALPGKGKIMSKDLLCLEEYSSKAEELVNSIGIPTQPKIIMEVSKEIKNPDADLSTVSNIISKDVAMSAKVLKVVNSAFFGLREKVDSIDRALSLMGMANFNKIIIASSLKETLGSNYPGIEHFWDHSMAVATIASHIAQKTGYESPESAYTAGLFHDCGIPFLLKKYKDYAEVSDFALGVVSSQALSGETKSIIGIEDERYKTHHCAVGYIVAKSWNLSPHVHQSIWYHHYVHLNVHVTAESRRLSAILILADYIGTNILFLSGGKCPVEPEPEWANIHMDVLNELQLQVDDIKDLREDMVDKIMVTA